MSLMLRDFHQLIISTVKDKFFLTLTFKVYYDLVPTHFPTLESTSLFLSVKPMLSPNYCPITHCSTFNRHTYVYAVFLHQMSYFPSGYAEISYI